MSPYYNDGQITIYHGDWRTVGLTLGASSACLVTSPPYNVGVDYDGWDDRLTWPHYWRLVGDWVELMAYALVPGGRCWVNTAVSVPVEPTSSTGPRSGFNGKRRKLLARGWIDRLDFAGLDLIDQIAWSTRGRGGVTAWGSWRCPSSPNLRGEWESIVVACKGAWEREAPAGQSGWRDGVGNWQELCSTVWRIKPEPRRGHPTPFPVELAARCIRLSTWPGETVIDPFCGSGTTLIAARDLGRRAIGVEISERSCEHAAHRLSQAAFDFGGVA